MRVTIGVDLGGTKLLAAVVDSDGHVVSLRRWPCRVSGYDESLDAITERVACLRRAAEVRGDPECIDGPTITALALEGDPLALRGLTGLGEWLGRGFALIAAVVEPSVIVIGGGLAEVAGELIAGPRARHTRPA